MTQNKPAEIGMPIQDIDTPALIIDLDSFEHNLNLMSKSVASLGVAHRPHAKTHKSPVIARKQIAVGAVGQCCQKVSEAEILVSGGVDDVLVSNQVVGQQKLERLAGLARHAKIGVCVDNLENIGAVNAAASKFGSQIDVLVEIDIGAGRCGVVPGAPAVKLAEAIESMSHLKFSGLQAYQGRAQHIRGFSERKVAIEKASEYVLKTIKLLGGAGIDCPRVTGGGTGTYQFEAGTGVWDEIQAGSYCFMDVDYGLNLAEDGNYFDTFQNSLFVLATVMSIPTKERAVLDAGHKASAIDSGLPKVMDLPDVEFVSASDEHGTLTLGRNAPKLSLGQKIRLIPGHCDPTVNLHDWYVGVRNNIVESIWPVAARGAAF